MATAEGLEFIRVALLACVVGFCGLAVATWWCLYRLHQFRTGVERWIESVGAELETLRITARESAAARPAPEWLRPEKRLAFLPEEDPHRDN